MNYLIIGGDDRLLYLAKMLLDDGNTVKCYALDMAKLPEGAQHTEMLDNADCVILPLPAEGKTAGALNAPFSAKTHSIYEILSSLEQGSLVCGGKLSPKLREAAEKKNLRLRDYMTRPEFTVGNAAVTAEGAVSLLADNLKSTLFGSSVLVIGYGRIGRLLAHKLRGLDAETYVLSRNSESRALAESMGLHAVSPTADSAVFSAFDAVINTAPAMLIPSLEALKKSCLLLELASAPGGIDRERAEQLGLRCIGAPGLPGRYAPISAAELIHEAIRNILREEKHE